MAAESKLIARHAAPVPRYTSYPTAPHFKPSIGNVHYVDWLAALPGTAELSLYVHIPFCHELCWYCGCNTKAVKRYDPVARYLAALETEIANVAALVPTGHGVTHVHWGGGSPNILTACHIRRLANTLRERFHVRGGAELAVEIDPRNLAQPQVDALGAAGVNRVSIGVQDFDAKVQAAINRFQPVEMTRRAVEKLRDAGIGALNIDLVYGLPHQTMATAERTIEQVLRLAPGRIAVFGYAHLPARLKHQRMIDAGALPGPADRHRLAQRIAELLLGAGYKQIGLDHFARPSDALAQGRLARNFQGYTTDKASTLLGLGASSIGRLQDGYVQNATPIAEYLRRIAKDGLAIARGLKLAPEDRMRAFAIERLMCEMSFSVSALEARFGTAARALAREAEALVAADDDGLVERTGDGFRVTERGRPFLRSVCARFDAYLPQSRAQHAAGV